MLGRTRWSASLAIAAFLFGGPWGASCANAAYEIGSHPAADELDQPLIIDNALLGRVVLVPAAAPALSAWQDEPASADRPVSSPPSETPAEEREWKSHFNLAAGGSAGNTQTLNVALIITSQRESENNATKVDGAFYYGSDRGDKSEYRFTAGVVQDWYIPDSRWFFFAQGRYDYDEFQSWWHRLGLHGGVGYKLYDREDFKLKLRAGLGANKEWGSIGDPLTPEGLLGLNIEWQITQKQKLTFDSAYYPDLETLEEFRAVSALDWTILLDEEAAMNLIVGLRHEYQSQSDPGVKPNDLRVFVGLQFDF